MTEHARREPARAVAWRCSRCTRLTVRMDHQPTPIKCDHCPGDQLEPQPLQAPKRPS